MARRHAVNPDKLKTDLAALRKERQFALAAQQRNRARRWLIAVLPVASVVMLLLSFAPWNAWPLAYVALAPWVIAMCLVSTRRRAAALGLVSGLLFWGAGLYWLWWITLVGYAALVLYMSAYWLAAALMLRGALERRVPAVLALPVTWVALETIRAYVASGFPWFNLAHSQWSVAPMIQIADFAGEAGVSFVVAMVTGALVDLTLAMIRPGPIEPARRAWISPVAAAAVLAATLGYGLFRLSEDTRRPGPVLGLVQQTFPIALGREPADPVDMVKEHLALSGKLINSGCDLVVWPETMLPMGMNADFLSLDPSKVATADLAELIPSPRRQDVEAAIAQGERPSDALDEARRESLTAWLEFNRAMGEAIAERSRQLDCPILAGGGTFHLNTHPLFAGDRWLSRNTALWFDRGQASPGSYSKMHLVPFSEYVPFKSSALWLHKALRWFVPPVMTQLDPGAEPYRFELVAGGRTWRIATPICYEGTFARVCRQLVYAHGSKQADIIANISNDGWFIWADVPFLPDCFQPAPHGSTEHQQHMAQYAFRAVENRVPVVRAVNTGVSASFDSNGRLAAVIERTVGPEVVRSMIPGVLLLGGRPAARDVAAGPRILVDSRTPLYSIVGDSFGLATVLAAIVLIAWPVIRRRARKGSPQ